MVNKELLVAILATIENVLLSADVDTADALWNILSALRGPDRHEQDKLYTRLVRRAAFPRIAIKQDCDGFGFGADFHRGSGDPDPDSLRGHYGDHIRWAAGSLDVIGRNPFAASTSDLQVIDTGEPPVVQS